MLTQAQLFIQQKLRRRHSVMHFNDIDIFGTNARFLISATGSPRGNRNFYRAMG